MHPSRLFNRSVSVVLGTACAVLLSGRALASQVTADQPYQAIVTGDELQIRSGAGTTYYPFGTLKKGDIVTVIGERFGWARVKTEGPAFRKFFGYVKLDELRLNADETQGTALGRVQVLAPNILREGDPSSSWKWLIRLEPESTLRVLGRLEADGTAYYTVALPPTAEGWISINFMRRATEEEIIEWNQGAARERQRAALPPEDPAESPADPAPADPAPPLADFPANNPPDREVQIIEPWPGVRSVGPDPLGREEQDVSVTDEPIPADTNEPDENTGETTGPKTLTEVTLDDLESAYATLKRIPVRGAEIEPLRDAYRAYLEGTELTDRQRAIAEARGHLLDARLKLQEQMLALDQLRNRVALQAEDAEQVRIALELAENYSAVGIVTASTIYDGKRLPQMLRLVDPSTGRTIVYVQPDDSFNFAGKIGRLIGIVGEKSYNGGLRLTVIKPRRVDILTANR